MTELGISLGWSHREPADRIISLVQEAESAGVDVCWVIDSQLAMRDAFLLLGLLASETHKIRLGPGVTNLITRHPTVVANSLVTLRSLAPGRVLAGVGAGDSAVFPLGLKPQSVVRLREGIVSLRALLAGETIDGPAGKVRLSGVGGSPEPIFLAASQPRMLQLAGAVADGVIIMGPADPEVQRMQMGHVDRGAEEARRSPGEVFRDVWVTMAVDGEEPGVDAVRSWASAQARWLTKWEHLPPGLRRFEGEMAKAAESYDFERHLSVSAEHSSVVSNELAATLAVAGDVDECAARIRQIIDVGADRVTVSLLSGGRERRLEDLLAVWEAASNASATRSSRA
ncbi:MAG: LLM class flavin-dependent oxidoreductase [Acidimicrobiia bacterium]